MTSIRIMGGDKEALDFFERFCEKLGIKTLFMGRTLHGYMPGQGILTNPDFSIYGLTQGHTVILWFQNNKNACKTALKKLKEDNFEVIESSSQVPIVADEEQLEMRLREIVEKLWYRG